MQRLDKFLSDAGAAARKDVKQLVRSGAVRVNGIPAQSAEQKIDETNDAVTLRGFAVEGRRTAVVMLHKPSGFVTSAEDPRDKTVMELLPQKYRRFGLMPVGRLDKETEGLLLFTNDGELAHRLISPKYEVQKEYYAEYEGTMSEEDRTAFSSGLPLRDGTVCKPALLVLLSPGCCRVCVTEGKYHQIRRMLASRGHPVTYLRREREGNLSLGLLPKGECRELTAEEVREIRLSTGLPV